jgi:hypothetical protein
MTANYWTCHWRFLSWRTDVNPEFQKICFAGSNKFTERGVAPGDRVFIVSLSGGQLFVGGRMTVERIVSRAEAMRVTRNSRLYEAREWILGAPKGGTPLSLHRRIAPELSKQIRFVSPSGEIKKPFFVSPTKLDVQATRGVRQLTRESGNLLERVIKISDRLPRLGNVITIGNRELDR